MTEEEMLEITKDKTAHSFYITNNLYYPPENRLFWRGLWLSMGAGFGFLAIYGMITQIYKFANWMGL